MISLLKQLPKIVADGKHKKRAAVAWCDKINTLAPRAAQQCRMALCPLGRGCFL
ncbi:MAG: hypothetical protein V9E86_09495 [Nitrosomonas sp.]